jgi:hypothetical protein
MSKIWTHDALATDLANYLRANTDAMVWENMQMGPVGSPRPDCFRINKSYVKFTPIAYEVKISVADFRRDITAGKWQSYLKYACGVVFAAPAGLINKADIPSGAGLIVRGPDGWRMAKSATLNTLDTLPREAWLKMLIDGINREAVRAQHSRSRSHHHAEEKLRKKFGSVVAGLAYDVERAESFLTSCIERAEARRFEISAGTDKELARAIQDGLAGKNRLDDEQKTLARVLHLPAEATPSELANALRVVMRRIATDAEVSRLHAAFDRMQRAINDGLDPLFLNVEG